jgi:hypothetical protein
MGVEQADAGASLALNDIETTPSKAHRALLPIIFVFGRNDPSQAPHRSSALAAYLGRDPLALPHWLHPPIGMVIGSSPTHWASSANQRKPLPSRAAAPEELRAVLDRIEANGRGKPIGEQVLADAHRRHAENDCPNRRD